MDADEKVEESTGLGLEEQHSNAVHRGGEEVTTG
jgi:hypothetical protein